MAVIQQSLLTPPPQRQAPSEVAGFTKVLLSNATIAPGQKVRLCLGWT